MSPRRNTPRRRGDRQNQKRAPFSGIVGNQQRESGSDGDWVVRRVSGTAAAKTYRCPGCGQDIRPATPHVVAWRAEGSSDDRRHWHSSCWEKREHRGVRFPRR